MVALANAANGYEQSDVEKLNPILETLESLSEAREIKNKLALTLEENATTQMQATERAAIAELLVAKPYMRTQHDKAAAWHELARTQNARTA